MDEDRSCPPSEQALRDFYLSREWKLLSYKAKLEQGARCQCCGTTGHNARIVSDHVKPIRFFWHLRLVRSNIQVLCEDCNHGKASWDTTDHRPGERQKALIADISRYLNPKQPAKLKEAITTAYSLDAITAREAQALIRVHALEHE